MISKGWLLVQTAINGDNRTDQKEIIPHKMEK